MKITILYDDKVKNTNISNMIEFYKKQIPNLNEKIVSKKLGYINTINSFNDAFVVVLSEEGRNLSSKAFSEYIFKKSSQYKNLVFCIGPPNGFSKPIDFGDDIISFSKMTFPHEIAILLLYEQIYRSKSILDNKKYHRE